MQEYHVAAFIAMRPANCHHAYPADRLEETQLDYVCPNLGTVFAETNLGVQEQWLVDWEILPPYCLRYLPPKTNPEQRTNTDVTQYITRSVLCCCSSDQCEP